MGRLQTDAEVMRASLASPLVFGVIYERHGVAVRRYVARRVGSQHTDDLAGEVFARAFRTRKGYRPERDSVLPWLLGVANHVIGDHRRKEHRRLATLERLAIEDHALVQHQDASLTLELVSALRRLPAIDRDTLLLVVWGELSREEAAIALDVPVGTVNSRISRARQRLSAELRPQRPTAPIELQLTGEPDV